MRRIVLLVLLLPPAACISPVEVDGSPCPCPDDYRCCPTLACCQPAQMSCPQVYPASSQAACARDADCGFAGEICQAWALAGGGTGGSKTCRRECPEEFPCAAGEVCALIVHDAQVLAVEALARACVPETPASGCEGLRCQGANMAVAGKAFCQGNAIAGCFLSLDPRCGLACQTVKVNECEAGSCQETPAGVECMTTEDGRPCDNLPCDRICAEGRAGATSCVQGALRRCDWLPWDEECDLCAQADLPCPAGTHCQEDAAGGSCVPD